jgi:hypothetical protein
MSFDEVFEIVCLVQAMSNYASDIHYTAKGKLFYPNHLFAERLGDNDETYDFKDEIFETVYMGRGKEPPLSEEVTKRVAQLTPEVSKDTQANFKKLRELIVQALLKIEGLSDLSVGEQDVFGRLASWLQRNNGLLWNQLEYTISELLNADDEDIQEWITVRGNHIPIKKGQTKEEAVKSFIESKGGNGEKEEAHTKHGYEKDKNGGYYYKEYGQHGVTIEKATEGKQKGESYYFIAHSLDTKTGRTKKREYHWTNLDETMSAIDSEAKNKYGLFAPED